MDKNKILGYLKVCAERYLLPLILGTVVMNIIFNTYLSGGSHAGLLTLLYIVYEAVLFAVFEFIRPRKYFRTFVYLALSMLILYFSFILLRMGRESSGELFIDWFYLDSADVGAVDEYMYFTFLSLGFFITSILYYFTVYRYRTFGTMLIILFPFVIYGKRDDSISTFRITVMLTVFLAIFLHERLVSYDVKKDTRINSSYVIAAALFVTFVGAVTMFLPKPNVQSELEKDSNIFDFSLQTEQSQYDDINTLSSEMYGGEPTGEILFRAESTENEEVIYLRRQSYDMFDGSQWYISNEYSVYEDEGVSGSEVNSSVYVYEMMKRLAQTGKYESYGLTEELFSEDRYSTVSWLSEYSEGDFAPNYLPAPLMTNFDMLTSLYVDPHGEIYFDSHQKLGISFSYVIEGDAEHEYARSVPFDWDGFIDVLYEACLNGDVSEREFSNIIKLRSYYVAIDNYSEDVYDLAHEITDGKDSDYEKAQAIVDYFENNGYSYDMYYDPDDDSLDHFLFESKIGACASYATAMTVMARISGLSARYVEGFAAYERDENGAYVIRDYNAHAFVEVYLPGAGWVTFDPTVSGYMSSYQNDNSTSEFLRAFLNYFSRIALFLCVIFVLVFIVFLDRITELIFRIRLKFKSNSDKVLALYTRILRLMELSTKEKLKGCTPDELCARAETMGADIMPVSELFKQTCFGGYSPTDEEISQVYEKYKAQWKPLAGKDKQKKKQTAV